MHLVKDLQHIIFMLNNQIKSFTFLALTLTRTLHGNYQQDSQLWERDKAELWLLSLKVA